MAQKQTRSRKLIIGLNEVVELITADELDSSNNNLIDEKDVIFLEEAMSESDDTITVTIDDAHAQSIEPNLWSLYLIYFIGKRFVLLLIFRIALYLVQSI